MAYAGGQAGDYDVHDAYFEYDGSRLGTVSTSVTASASLTPRSQRVLLFAGMAAPLGVYPEVSMTCELGAARVQVQGLVENVRDGVLLRDPRR